MTTTKYSKQNQETAAGPQGSFVQDDLVHLKFELFVGTSAEAYITYFCVGFPTLCQGPRNFFLYLFIYLSTIGRVHLYICTLGGNNTDLS